MRNSNEEMEDNSPEEKDDECIDEDGQTDFASYCGRNLRELPAAM